MMNGTLFREVEEWFWSTISGALERWDVETIPRSLQDMSSAALLGLQQLGASSEPDIYRECGWSTTAIPDQT